MVPNHQPVMLYHVISLINTNYIYIYIYIYLKIIGAHVYDSYLDNIYIYTQYVCIYIYILVIWLANQVIFTNFAIVVSFRHKEIAKAGSRRKRRNVLKKRSAQFRLVIGKGDSSQVMSYFKRLITNLFNLTQLVCGIPTPLKKKHESGWLFPYIMENKIPWFETNQIASISLGGSSVSPQWLQWGRHSPVMGWTKAPRTDGMSHQVEDPPSVSLI